MSVQPRDPSVRHNRVSAQGSTLSSSKRLPSFAVHQQVEGEWDEDSWFPGVVQEVIQKKGQVNEYRVDFEDGDKGVYHSQQLRKHPDPVDRPRFSLQVNDSSSNYESEDESEDQSGFESSDTKSECTFPLLD